jgi:hypothetical protein
MHARHLAPIGLGIMGLIALGALPGTAYAAKKDKAKAVQKEHKVYWCHATGSWRNPWVIIEIDFHGDGQNPNSRGHDHSHHVNDMPAVLVDGEWTCEDEEPSFVECDNLTVQAWLYMEEFGYPGGFDLYGASFEDTALVVRYFTSDVTSAGYLGELSINNTTLDAPNPGPASAFSRTIGVGVFEDVLIPNDDWVDNDGLECQISDASANSSTPPAPMLECWGDGGVDDYVTALQYEWLDVRARIYTPTEEPFCEKVVTFLTC